VIVQLVCIFAISPIFPGTTIYAGTALSQARHFAKSDNHFASITEYKRYLFFNDTFPGKADVLMEMAQEYYFLEDWGNVNSCLRHAENVAFSDSIKNRVKEQQIIYSLREEKYDQALVYIHMWRSNHLSHSYLEKSYWYEAIAHLYLAQWNNAYECFITYYNKNNLFSDELNHWFLKHSPPNTKNAIVAYSLSALVPGMGQLYVGNVKDAINSLTINMLSGYPVIQSFLHKHSTDFFLYVWLFQRFYIGNIRNVGNAVREKNEVVNKTYRLQFMEAIHTIERTKE